MSGVAFIDTETTGLDPDRHEIWEVGLILPDGSEHEWQLPVDLSRADPMALAIGRFHERRKLDCADSYEDGDWLAEFSREFVSLTRGLHLAGAVVSFDAERLWKLLRASGECPMWHYHLIDVEALAVGFAMADAKRVAEEVERRNADPDLEEWQKAQGCLGPSWRRNAASPPWKSEELSQVVGVDPDDFDRHTALGDARWAKAIYEAVMVA